MIITLVRHAEVDEKYAHCYNGHIDISLSKKGVKNAKALGEKLQDKKFDAVFCSDLKRARETLEQFPHADDKIIFTQELREKSWGKHEGMSFDEIIEQNEIVYENFLQWIHALGGEPYELYIKRIKEFFLEFLPSTDKKNILVVTHAGVIRVLISIVQELSLEEAFCINVPHSSYILYNAKNSTFEYM